MDRRRLFSIGKLSKLTGVHIQSLRYYEAIGILKPAYVDPDSLYRYYTFPQTRIVEAIQYCADLDIPLKQFREFLSEADGRIDYALLLAHGQTTAREKMRRIEERLMFLEAMQSEIDHAEECRTHPLVRATFPEKLCWAIPYEGTQTDPNFHSAMYRLISEVERHGLHAGFNNGQLLRYTGQVMRPYLFIDVRETGAVLDQYPQIMQIPGGDYLCAISSESCIRRAPELFPEAFARGAHPVVVEVELFTEQFSYSEPVFELRCSL